MIESASILTSTKAALGVGEDDVSFDAELITFINSVLARLNQLGVGPAEGFSIAGKETLWTAFIGASPLLNNVKTYMYLRVRRLFDPPEIGFVLTAIDNEIKEEEWRLVVATESAQLVDPGLMTDAPTDPTP